MKHPRAFPLLFGVQVHGASAGGDADELRLLSTKDTFINLRAHGGSLDFLSTKVKKKKGVKSAACFLRVYLANQPYRTPV